jgi:hypothetical protein
LGAGALPAYLLDHLSASFKRKVYWFHFQGILTNFINFLERKLMKNKVKKFKKKKIETSHHSLPMEALGILIIIKLPVNMKWLFLCVL